jgi:hypothetical protein
MSQERARFRAAVAHEIGGRLEDLLESAKSEAVRWEGCNQGLLNGQKAIEGLHAHVDKDIEDGQYDLPTGKIAKLYVTRASQVCANLAVQAANQRAMMSGSVSMADSVVKIVKKFFDEEIRKAEAIAAAEAEPLVGSVANPQSPEGSAERRTNGRLPPVRPGLTIKQQRLAEEAAEKASAPTPEPTPAPVEVLPVVQEPAPEPETPPTQTWTMEEIKAHVAAAEERTPKPKPEPKPVKPEPKPARKKPGPKPKTRM